MGEAYQVFIGGDVEGAQTDGFYDAATVTGFSCAVPQQYTGTEVGMGFGHHGGQRPDGFDPGGDQEPPEGFESPGGGRQPPDGLEPPEGTNRRPGGDDRRPDGEPGQMPGGFAPSPGSQDVPDGLEPSTRFYMADQVNAFSGVTDAA